MLWHVLPMDWDGPVPGHLGWVVEADSDDEAKGKVCGMLIEEGDHPDDLPEFKVLPMEFIGGICDLVTRIVP